MMCTFDNKTWVNFDEGNIFIKLSLLPWLHSDIAFSTETGTPLVTDIDDGAFDHPSNDNVESLYVKGDNDINEWRGDIKMYLSFCFVLTVQNFK